MKYRDAMNIAQLQQNMGHYGLSGVPISIIPWFTYGLEHYVSIYVIIHSRWHLIKGSASGTKYRVIEKKLLILRILIRLQLGISSIVTILWLYVESQIEDHGALYLLRVEDYSFFVVVRHCLRPTKMKKWWINLRYLLVRRFVLFNT